ncbi:Hypothetical protein A7982_04573 [Minicystis rosea]|nr:Hypothetical protein A7982_04573 [Minicystis rosea]
MVENRLTEAVAREWDGRIARIRACATSATTRSLRNVTRLFGRLAVVGEIELHARRISAQLGSPRG